MVNSGINQTTNQRITILIISMNKPIVKTIKGPETNFKMGLIMELAKAKIHPVIAISIKSPVNNIPGTTLVAINIPTELVAILAMKRRSKCIDICIITFLIIKANRGLWIEVD